jgi:hypothetical protein
MSTATQTTKTASQIIAGDIIRPEGRRTPVEVLAAWTGRNGRIEIAALGKGKVVFNLAANETVEVA